VKHRGRLSVIVWGAFLAAGIGELIVCGSHLMLWTGCRKACFPHLKCYVIFQQDNASAQIAKTTKKWLESKSIRLMFWPGQSADLNPVVNIWSLVLQ